MTNTERPSMRSLSCDHNWIAATTSYPDGHVEPTEMCGACGVTRRLGERPFQNLGVDSGVRQMEESIMGLQQTGAQDQDNILTNRTAFDCSIMGDGAALFATSHPGSELPPQGPELVAVVTTRK